MKIKKLLNLPIRMFPKFKLARRLALSLGNCICCPAVTYSRLAREDFKFDGKYKFACDWDAWERIGRKKGAFLRVCKPLMGHRIHEDSETSKIMADNKRVAEEYDLFRRFWIKPIAKLISKFYTKGANNNNL